MTQFAVFDIDGTLLRWQLFHGLINALAKDGVLGQDAVEKIRKARMQWKHRAHADAFKEYEEAIVKLYFAALKQIPPEHYDAAVQRTISQYKDQVYSYTKSLLKQLKEKDYLLFAISGSHSELVERLAKYYGFDDWVGTEYVRKDGRFTGAHHGAYKDKDVVLRKLMEKHGAGLAGSIAVGDTASDIQMLEMVEHPIAFNPNQELFTYARDHSWKIVVERKNVIYELESKDGTYVLAQTNT